MTNVEGRRKIRLRRGYGVTREALARALGERYEQYMKRTKRLIPLVY